MMFLVGMGRARFLRRELEELLREGFWRLKLKTRIGECLLPAPEVRKLRKFMVFNSVFE